MLNETSSDVKAGVFNIQAYALSIVTRNSALLGGGKRGT